MMRRSSLVYALIAVMALGIFSADAHQYSQKTYLAIRPHDINTAMEYTTWHRNAYTNHEPTIHTHFQFVPFYQDSERSADLGRYFGVGNGSNSFRVDNDLAVSTRDINKNFLIHDWGHQDGGLAGTASFDPYQESYGFRFDLFQHIDQPFKDFFFKFSTVLEQVNHSMKLKVANGTPEAFDGTSVSYSLQDFFAGRVNITADNPALVENQQSPLTMSKITERRSKFGLADLDFGLGYKYLRAKHHVYISLDLTIPTGNRVRGDYLFEPVYGNGRHVGLGGSLDVGLQLWRSKRANLRLLWATRYRYLFENSEYRMFGIKGEKFGQYYLGGVLNQQNKPLFPLANELTRSCGVKPGSLFDTMFDFAFKSSGFSIDLGYNLYWKDRESVYLRNAQSFDDKNLVIADPSYKTQSEVLGDPGTVYRSISNADFDLDSVKTPAVLTNKLFGGFGYSFSIYEQHLCSVGLGGSYEFATDNNALEAYAVWAKIGFSI
ncbi:MAG: hypothetical protein WCW33_03950 [Candidatus Babeliales bacterium]